MIILLVYLLFYVAAPYMAYRIVFHWTGSAAASWAAATIMIPVGVFLYVRTFERLKHGSRLSKPYGDGTPSGECDPK
jgi:hypothetical protein